MSERILSSGTLIEDSGFRRFLGWSLGLHILATAVFLVSPMPRSRVLSPAPIFVDVVQLPAPTRPAAKRPRQVLDEPVVIPKRPKAKPKPKAEPKPKPKAEPKPKPEAKPAQTPPPTAPVSAEELLAQLREQVQARPIQRRQTQAAAAGGRFDPEMAAYQRRLKALLYSNWVGAGVYRNRDDLVATLEVGLGPRGTVLSVLVVDSSGNRHFDETAERAVWRSGPFPAPPRGALTLVVAFDPRESL